MRLRLVVAVASLLVLFAACRKKQAVQAPATPKAESAVLLLRDDSGHVGRVRFENAGGSIELTEENTLTSISDANTAPAAPVTLSADEISRRFGAALDGLPSPQLEFTLYFRLGTDQLTAESEALLDSVLRAVQDRSSTDVSIIGHTDTTGSPQSNFTLGLQRAEKVAGFLRNRGLAAEFITVESHGESDPLVPTARGVNEPRNRRVEITVR